MADYKTGELVNAKYEILGVLGEGGMGTVYKAHEVGLDRVVALKVPKPQFIENEDFMARFTREAKLVAKLSHDNIVQVFEFSNRPGMVYMALEFVEGVELGNLVKEPPPDLTIGDMVEMLRRSCEGLSYAHEHGIVHRDIKPANILVSKVRGGGWRVKVMDFGIAHIEQGELFTQQLTQLTAAGAAMGTPSYMAPEQIQGQQVTQRSDIYSMACVFYFCFTRRNLYEGSVFTVISQHLSSAPTPPNVINPNLPESMVPIILKGLAKDPADRWETAREMAFAAEEVMAGYSRQRFAEMFVAGGADETVAIPLVEGGVQPTVGLTAGTPPRTPTIGSARTAATTPTVQPDHGARYPGLPQTQAVPGGMAAPAGFAPPGSATVAAAGLAGGAPDTYGQTIFHTPSHGTPVALPQRSSPLPIFLVLFLVLAGGAAAWFFLGRGNPGEEFNEALRAANLSYAVELLGELSPADRNSARERLKGLADAAIDNALSQLNANKPDSAQSLAANARETLEALRRADLTGFADMTGRLDAIEAASAALRDFSTTKDRIARTPSGSLKEADIAALEAIITKVETSASRLVSASLMASLRNDAAAERSRLPARRPDPTPTPAAARDEAEFARLAAIDVRSTEPDVLLREWNAFKLSFPTYKPAEVDGKIAELRLRKIISPEMVAIPGGVFTMGIRRAQDPNAGVDEGPPIRVQLSPYEIGRYEVTAEAFAEFLNSVGGPKGVDLNNRPVDYMREDQDWNTVVLDRATGRWIARSGMEDFPALLVTWYGAEQFTIWLSLQTGERYDLPTEAEWERAALGPSGRNSYPWGESFEQRRGNFYKDYPQSKPYPRFVLHPVTAFPDGRTPDPEGVFNLAGNVKEWVRDWYEPQYPTTDDTLVDWTGPESGSSRVLRGGSWYTSDERKLRSRAREQYDPRSSSDEIGFRVVRRP